MSLPLRSIVSYGLPPLLVALAALSYYLWIRPMPSPDPVETSNAYSLSAEEPWENDPLLLPAPLSDPAYPSQGDAQVLAPLPPVDAESSAPGAAGYAEILSLQDAEAALPELALPLNADALWEKCLLQDKLLQRLLRALDDVALGEIPLSSCMFLRSQELFVGEDTGAGLLQSAKSEARYDAVVNCFCTIDPTAAAKLFARLEPFMQQALNGLGYRDRNVRELLRAAMAMLMTVPVPPEAPTLLTSDGKLYRWADSELEALNDVQKLFLRLGSRNMLKVRQQLSNLAEAADLDAAQ
jgi:hypothetical protein